ncbi:MAG: homoserine O-acetyltransferase [Calditrichae bacterium]|nr:homoserine O-acetyltransferase [Calditrichia bacterium]
MSQTNSESDTCSVKRIHNTNILFLNDFKLENGFTFSKAEIAFEIYGNLNSDKSNVILVCHALTGSAHAADLVSMNGFEKLENDLSVSPLLKYAAQGPGWWDSIIGPGKPLDTNKYCIISSNILGSCYGTTGPVNINPQTSEKYAADFPEITIRDMVKMQKYLLDYLKVEELQLVIGGSLGGMQVLEWALMYPQVVKRIMPVATSAQHSAWAIGLNEAARLAIKNDPDWKQGKYEKQPQKGLALARIVAMLSYRSQPSYQLRQGRKAAKPYREDNDYLFSNQKQDFAMQSYLHYQGEKLVERFDANTYLTISNAMDSHDIARDRGTIEEVLGSIKAKTCCVGIDSDLLYPADEQKQIAGKITGAEYNEIKSIHGHDAFLIEFDQLGEMVRRLLSR